MPGGSSPANYGNPALIANLAERTGCDAVWPGWGHASEDPELPRALATAGIAFLGPPARAMGALGDKVASQILAQAAGVPTLPWSGSAVRVSLEQCSSLAIPDEAYNAACVDSADEAAARAAEVGFPCMIKASAGGGGRGIRRVESSEQARAVFPQVMAEVPGSPIFLMRCAPVCRHVEVQLLADEHGNVASLHSRDCTVQRRHQKVVEEAPASAVPPRTRSQMERAARALASAVGYVGAATAEFLFLPDEGGFYFLELNPRLQVEHPVTEWITGCNLPAAQLRIGMGAPLWAMSDVAACYDAAEGAEASPIDFDAAECQPPRGHVIAARVTSEDPNDGFKPTTGAVSELLFRGTPSGSAWGYFSIKSSGHIHEFSDSQFGHVFGFGADRAGAISALVMALQSLVVRGEIHTITSYVSELVQTPEFRANTIHTGWLDDRIARRIPEGQPPYDLAVACGALYRSLIDASARRAEWCTFLERGQMPPESVSLTTFNHELVIRGFRVDVLVKQVGPERWTVRILDVGDDKQDDGVSQPKLAAASRASHERAEVQLDAHHLRDGGLLVRLDGASHVVYAQEEPAGTRMVIDGRRCLLESEIDRSVFTAPSNGKLARCLVADGARVVEGTSYAEIEVMKMQMPLIASASGTIAWKAAEGQAISVGDELARVDTDDENIESAERTPRFRGGFKLAGSDRAGMLLGGGALSAHRRFVDAHEAAVWLVDGFAPVRSAAEAAEDLLEAMDDAWLPLLTFRDVLGRRGMRLPAEARDYLTRVADDFERELVQSDSAITGDVAATAGAQPELPATQLRAWIEANISGEGDDPDAAAITECLRRFEGGRAGHAHLVIAELIDRWLAIQDAFASGPLTDEGARTTLGAWDDCIADVVGAARAHAASERASAMLHALLSSVVLPDPSRHLGRLQRLSGARATQHAALASLARTILERGALAELRSVCARALSDLQLVKVSTSGALSSRQSQEALALLAQGATPAGAQMLDARDINTGLLGLLARDAPVEEALPALFCHASPALRARAIKAYVARVYGPVLASDVSVGGGDCYRATWTYRADEALRGGFLPGATAGGDADGRDGPAGQPRGGMLLVVRNWESLPRAAANLASVSLPQGIGVSVLHVSVDALALLEDTRRVAVARRLHARQRSWGSASDFDLDSPDFDNGAVLETVMEGLPAALAAASCSLRAAGVVLVTVIASRGTSAPARRSFRWRAVGGAGYYEEVRELEGLEVVEADLMETSRVRALAKAHAERVTAEGPPLRLRSGAAFSLLEQGGPRRPFLRVYARLIMRTPPAPCAAGAGALPGLARRVSEGVTASMPELVAQGAEWAHCLTVWTSPACVVCADATDPGARDAYVAGVLAATFAPLADSNSDEGAALEQQRVREWETRVAVCVRGGVTGGGGNAGDGASSALVWWRVRGEAPWNGRVGSVTEIGKEKRLVSGACVLRTFNCNSSSGAGPPPAEDVANANSAGSDPHTALRAHSLLPPVARRRLAAARARTTWAYDLPGALGLALRRLWEESGAPRPPGSGPLLEARLLESDPDSECGGLREAPPSTPRGSEGQLAMAAWQLLLRTPSCPEGRPCYLLANDATVKSGSFGVAESELFARVAHAAADGSVPLLYHCCTSGARMDLAQAVLARFKVAWLDERQPALGVDYLYLDDADVTALGGATAAAEVVRTRRVEVAADGGAAEVRHALLAVIGDESDGLGVESLMGSAKVASAFSRAYDESFTLTYVSGLSVGIGAYLARLGCRVVQRQDASIILTGAAALNKLLGHEVYASHHELGGPRVHTRSGLSQLVVADDKEGLARMLGWLEYVPAFVPPRNEARSLPDSPRAPSDAAARAQHDRAELASSAGLLLRLPGGGAGWDALAGTPADLSRSSVAPPTAAAAGAPLEPEALVAHLFDAGSFVELMGGWARTVVVGRARLGGVAVGVVATQTRSVCKIIPGDPGLPDPADAVDSERAQAGQVWYPDSAAKTAQALRDAAREGLPLVVLACWRGFSGGRRDLYEGILQCGSGIVEALRTYPAPVTVYVPPGGELRGGAWVVVDRHINPARVEMYVDPSARGSILEPEGVVEIKLPPARLAAAARHFDRGLAALLRAGDEQAAAARQAAAGAAYRMAAARFAALHDVPERMLATGAIRGVVSLSSARRELGWRLRRRLAVGELESALRRAEPGSLGVDEAIVAVRRAFLLQLAEVDGVDSSVDGAVGDVWENDERVARWAWSERARRAIAAQARERRAAHARRMRDAWAAELEAAS